MEESDELERMLLLQQTHELLCPDCDNCVTNHLIVRKRKREFLHHGAVLGRVEDYEVEEAQSSSSDDGDELSKVLLEQDTHDLFCPVCEYTITGEMILQKRKRESELLTVVDKLRSIEGDLEDLWTATRDSFADSAELDELHMRRVLYEQSNYELLCPDCDACITHEVIFQKRKRRPVKPYPGGAQRDLQAWTFAGIRPAESMTEGNRDGNGAVLEEQEKGDPPLKRKRRGFVGADSGVANQEEKILPRVFQEQQTHDITCPDCHAVITCNVILRRKVNRFVPLGNEVQKASLPTSPPRPSRKGGRLSLARNPWKTRYKLFYRSPNPGAAIAAAIPAAGTDERDETYRLRIAHYGEVTRSLTQSLLLSEREVHALIPSLTIAERLRAIRHRFIEPYESPTSWIYFVTLLFLWLIWFVLRQN